MFKLEKVKRKKFVFIVSIIIAIVVTAMMLLSQKEVEETIVSKIGLNKQNEYKATKVVDGITWAYDIDDDGNAINVHVEAGMVPEEVTIPSSLDGHSVVEIRNEYQRSCLGSNANNVKSIIVPSSVTSIGESAFYECSSLTSISIPNSVKSIGEHVFAFCSNLTSIKIPNSVTRIGFSSFDRCSSLTSIKIPEGVIAIERDTFNGCSSLTSIIIPSSVSSIGDSAFKGCSSLTSIEITSSVTSIGSGAFYGCSSLTSITIPSSVTSIKKSAFSNCRNMTIINVSGENSYYCTKDGILYNKNKTLLIQCPGGKVGNIAILSSVISIEANAFDGCRSITGSIIIPSGVTKINNETFKDCEGLTNINIPNSVTSIGWYAFERCSSLTNIEIPSNVTSIGRRAFFGCSNLTSIEIPSSVTSIGEEAFCSCDSLTSINVSEDNESYSSENGILYNKNKDMLIFCLEKKQGKLIIPSSVTRIGGSAFEGCSSLTSISIPNSVTSIGSNAFDGCSSLTSIEIPSSVTSIGYCTFYGCSSLTNISIPNSVTSIGEIAFHGCTSLTNIEIPSSVTSIERGAFQGCRSLTSVSIQSNVTSIGERTFYGCRSLTIYTSSDYVANYAKENNITYVLDKIAPIVQVTAYKYDTNEPNNCGNEVKGKDTFNNNGTYEVSSSWVNYGVAFKLEASDDSEVNSKWKWNENNIYTDTLDEYEGGEKSYSNATLIYNQLTSEGWRKAQYTVTDKVGNSTTINIVVKIDKTKPEIKIEEYTKTWTKSDIELKMNVIDNASVVTSIKINEANVILENSYGTYKVNKNGTYNIKAIDEAGNTNEKSIVIDNIDKKAPTIKSVEVNPTEWTKEDVILKVNAEDEGSGLATKCYSFDGGTTWQEKNTKTYTENTENIVIKVRDNAGNITQYSEEISITKIDKRGPTIKRVEVNPTEWTKGNVTLKVNAEDEGSGLATKCYSFDGGTTWQEGNTKTYTENTENIVIKVKDNVGNITQYSEEISITKIDKRGPTIKRVEVNPTEWTKGNVTLKVNAEDEGSGLATKCYSFDGGTTWQEGNTKTYTENTENIVIKVRDSVGNIMQYSQTISITKIDKKAPTIKSVEVNPTEWTRENVTLEITAEDEESGLSGKCYSFDGGTTWQEGNTKTYTENTEDIVIKVRDNVGNIKTETIQINNIDKEAPTLEVKKITEGENIELEIIAIDSGVGLKKVTVNGKEVNITNNKGKYNITEEGTYEVIAEDKLGNINKETVTISSIELTVEIKTYEVTEDNGINYIEKIMPNTSIEEVKRKIETNGTIEIYKGEEKITDNSKQIATGMEIIIKLDDQEKRYTVVVTGDLTGNGKMGIGDLSKLSRYAAGLDKTLSVAYLRASDLIKDGKYGRISDISKMSRVIAGMDNL